MFPVRTKTNSIILLLLSIFAATACSPGSGSGGADRIRINPEDGWLIDLTYVADGGPGVDGIPAIENPQFESAATITTVAPGDRVIVLRDGGQVKAYPEDIMDYHEVVNDGPANDPFTMSYCPLTGSALAWKGTAAHADSTYGVSGLLYNSNLLLYDRQTQSLWSQLLQLSVNGPRIGEQPENINVLVTTLATLQSMYPDALVMTRDTGTFRPYDEYPYGNFMLSADLFFDISRYDNRLHPKERVIGLHEGSTSKVYQRGVFGELTHTINDQFNDQSIVVVGNSSRKFAAIYSRVLSDGTILSFDPVQDDLPNVMMDTEGNVWDIFGAAVSGPREGVQLDSVQSYTAMWFAWVAHFDTVEIYF
jgi:hypothetical protein